MQFNTLDTLDVLMRGNFLLHHINLRTSDIFWAPLHKMTFFVTIQALFSKCRAARCLGKWVLITTKLTGTSSCPVRPLKLLNRLNSWWIHCVCICWHVKLELLQFCCFKDRQYSWARWRVRSVFFFSNAPLNSSESTPPTIQSLISESHRSPNSHVSDNRFSSLTKLSTLSPSFW